MRKLTDKTISALRPKAQTWEKQAPTCPGLSLRISPRGKKSWSLRYRDNGKQWRKTIGVWPSMSADQARAVAGKKPMYNPLTLAELVEEYLQRWSRPRRRTTREDERVLVGVVLPFFGSTTPAASIRRRNLTQWLDSMVAEGKRAACNRYWSHFRRCLRWAVEVDILDVDPTAGVRAVVRELPRERLAQPEEVRLLWHGLMERSPSAQHAVRVVFATGLRVGEVLGGRWDDINEDAWIIPATETKARRSHTVPMTGFLQQLLKDVKADLLGEAYLFPGRAGGHVRSQTVGQAISRCLPELEDFRIHDARRLVGTWMAENGVALEVISALLGHTPSGITQRHYLHRQALLPRMRNALVAWQGRLQEILDESEDRRRGALG